MRSYDIQIVFDGNAQYLYSKEKLRNTSNNSDWPMKERANVDAIPQLDEFQVDDYVFVSARVCSRSVNHYTPVHLKSR